MEDTVMQHILVAYDGGEPARRALETAVELATHFDASIAIVSVVPRHPGRMPVDPWDDRPVHERQLAEAREIVARRGITPELIEPSGDPAQAIERVAEMGRFDTIVVGTRDQAALARWFQGSVSTHVATHAQATVVIAR
jgi:nucleotide-binding universal stress UspA family protein